MTWVQRVSTKKRDSIAGQADKPPAGNAIASCVYHPLARDRQKSVKHQLTIGKEPASVISEGGACAAVNQGEMTVWV